MTRAALVLAALLILLMLAGAGVRAAPWLDLFAGQRPARPRRPSGAGSRSGRDRFKSICRTINADNYAFPGRVPYPSAPLCPY